MKREELLAEIQRAGGAVEPVVKFCQFQTFGQSFVDFCVQPADSPYRLNLGSDGGPAVCCEGMPQLKGVRKKEVGGRVIAEPELEKVEPCPFKVEGKVLGWRIMLPAQSEPADSSSAGGG